jgi:hypothetical protein
MKTYTIFYSDEPGYMPARWAIRATQPDGTENTIYLTLKDREATDKEILSLAGQVFPSATFVLERSFV